MLWDIIRDWFVQYVWGGFTSSGGSFGGLLGNFTTLDLSSSDNLYANNLWIKINNVVGSGDGADYTSGSLYLSLGDWLSTTSTIIVLALLCLFLFLVVRYLFRLTSGLIRGR